MISDLILGPTTQPSPGVTAKSIVLIIFTSGVSPFYI